MRVLDLFSGIGGFSLGLERAGMQTVAFCEIDPFCRRVLAKHWPGVLIYDDVRTLRAERLVRDGIAVDVICGGFPCQDISLAGKGAGIDGAKSGLWAEYARIIGDIRPRFVIVENVSALLGRGLDRVLGDLAALGFDAEWHCIPATAVGAPHRRDRIWIVAYTTDTIRRSNARGVGASESAEGGETSRWRVREGKRPARNDGFAAGGSHVADADFSGLEGGSIFGGYLAGKLAYIERSSEVSDAICINDDDGGYGTGTLRQQKPARISIGEHWLTEPALGELVDGVSDDMVRFAGRVATGVPNRVAKLKAIGNAVVPQIPEMIGRAIMAFS